MNRLLTSLLLILPITACTSIDQSQSSATKIGLANPASEYCIAQGGKLLIKNEHNGQVGYCTLPNGTEMEEWALYRASQQACLPEQASSLVGKKGLSEQQIQQMTKAKTVRLVNPNQPVTMDYRIDRVTVTVDPITQIITQANCG